ncbi:MAG: glycoside hydrolase family 3 N-terminal domain-containing protein [Undibacterium sp.]|nr:glycoside hydrolase family 3 N-terminal domain-containing protein [Undibacterium sp.]
MIPKNYFSRAPYLAALMLLSGAAVAATAPLADWPHVKSAIVKDPEIEARIGKILGGMSLQQKIGQMTQPEIKFATPADVKKYYIGSILNGGGSWPQANKYATAADWVALADQYYDASMSTDMPIQVPVIWGIDAIHGNSNVHGATLFPHNIGLGAAHNPKLVGKMAAEVGKAVRATGISWVFAPTLAVGRDARWGRAYESFSEDGKLVREYGAAYVTGLQGSFKHDANVVATAKHFIGDGGTDQGKDRGVNKASLAQMINQHGQGYYGAFAAGAQTVMASYNSWNDVEAKLDYGKMHGSKALLTDALKTRMGFDGFVVSDWDGIAEVPGCSNDSCAQAINAGIDMVMVPDNWKSFIANTIAQVQDGQIAMARIDDAVTRILRVKLRAGLFGKKPSDNAYAGKQDALQSRDLARQAVRESLVLLKNNAGVLPLSRGKKILVVGKSADNMSNQSGGWSLTWQGTENKNSDFSTGDTLLAGIIEAAGAANVTYSATAAGIDVTAFDAVIAVIGETPYAEGFGDIAPASSLSHSSRHPEDLAVLLAVSGKGKPVVTLMVAGRALYVNDLLNLSDSFVAAWLPGSEGKGVSDVLFKKNNGKINHHFSGTLAYSWPKVACPSGPVSSTPNQRLFALGYGLKYGSQSPLAQLDLDGATATCSVAASLAIFTQSDRTSYPLVVTSGTRKVMLGADTLGSSELSAVKVDTQTFDNKKEAKRVSWTGLGRIEAQAAFPSVLAANLVTDGVLQFDTMVTVAPKSKVSMAMECGDGCTAALDMTAVFKRLAGASRHTVKIPLACFVVKGADLNKVKTPFSVSTDASFVAAFGSIEIIAGAAKDKDALNCEELK